MAGVTVIENESVDAVRLYLARLMTNIVESTPMSQAENCMYLPASKDVDVCDLTKSDVPAHVSGDLVNYVDASDTETPLSEHLEQYPVKAAGLSGKAPFKVQPLGQFVDTTDTGEGEPIDFCYTPEAHRAAVEFAFEDSSEDAEWLIYGGDEEDEKSESEESTASKSTLQRMQEQVDRVADAVDTTVSRAFDKMLDTYTATDEFAEKHAAKAEALVNRKASYVADRSVAAARSVNSTAKTKAEQAGEYIGRKLDPMVQKADKYVLLANDSAERAAEKANEAAKRMQARTTPIVCRASQAAKSGVDKAKHFSLAARSSVIERMHAMSRKGTGHSSGRPGGA